MLVTTSAGYDVCQISFSKWRVNVVVPSLGGSTVTAPESASEKLNAPVFVEPSMVIIFAFSEVHVRSTVVLFGTLPADGTNDPEGLWRIFVGVKSEFGSLQRIIFEL